MEAKKTTAAKSTVKKAVPAKTAARSTAKKTTKSATAASRTKTVTRTKTAKSTAKTTSKPATTKKAEQTKPQSREADTGTADSIAGSVKENIEKGVHTVDDTGKDILDIGGDILTSAYGYAVKAISSAKKPIKGLVSKLTFRSNVDELLKWTELYEKGVITKAELEAKKNKLI